GQLEFFNLTGSGNGGNTYDINDTTATNTTTIGDGIAGNSGDSTWNINANNLSANNLFQGFDGNDQFNLNINVVGSSIGENAAFAIASLHIEGNDNLPGMPGDTVNRDRLTVNDNSGVRRALDYLYLNSQGDLNVAANPLFPIRGLFGGILANGVVTVRS